MRTLLAIALFAGCAGSPANVAGNYTVALTNRDNGCNFQNWTVGNMATGISVTITQNGGAATANVTGGGGLILDGVLGGHTFTGNVDGDNIDLKNQGTKAMSMGNCTFTYNGEISGQLTNDTLSGRISYSAATNGNTDCATLQGCVSFQDFNGTRPPQ